MERSPGCQPTATRAGWSRSAARPSRARPAVPRRFVAATETALAEPMAADLLSAFDLVVVMVDWEHFAESCCVVAHGIGVVGSNRPLALEEGCGERDPGARSAGGLQERGLDVTRPILVVIDGSKALACAVRDVFDRPVIARCQLHKRNVRDKLPQRLRATVERRTRCPAHRARPGARCGRPPDPRLPRVAA